MNYRVHFTTGQYLVIGKEVFTLSFQEMLKDPEGTIYINPDHITHIVPEEDTAAGIANTPSPNELRTQKQKDREELLKDPKMLLKRAAEGGEE